MKTEAPRRNTATIALLAVIVVAGLGVRVGYAVERPSAPPPDADAYARIAANLYRHGSFDARPAGVAREVQPSSAYSPGLPLLVAGLYLLTGGEHLSLALVVLAFVGAAAIPLSYLLGERLAGAGAGLIAAAALAAYPALIEYQGLLLTEPLASTLLVGAVLAYLRATERPPSAWPWWPLAGALLGLLALVRPEYLVLAALLLAAWLCREGLRGGLTRGRLRAVGLALASCLLACVVVVAPWTVRNEIVLGRFVPLSTGGGKALFVGTYLEADGDAVSLRELLLSRRPALRRRLERGGPVDDPHRFVLERVLARVAAERYPGLETDAALGRLGRAELDRDLSEEPLRFGGMLAEKAYAAWTDSARAVMEREPWRALQLAIAALSLAGLVLLGLRRRFEAVPLAIVLLYMSAVAALLISSPRRELVVLPLLASLAGVAATAAVDSLARWRR